MYLRPERFSCNLVYATYPLWCHLSSYSRTCYLVLFCLVLSFVISPVPKTSVCWWFPRSASVDSTRSLPLLEIRPLFNQNQQSVYITPSDHLWGINTLARAQRYRDAHLESGNDTTSDSYCPFGGRTLTVKVGILNVVVALSFVCECDDSFIAFKPESPASH